MIRQEDVDAGEGTVDDSTRSPSPRPRTSATPARTCAQVRGAPAPARRCMRSSSAPPSRPAWAELLVARRPVVQVLCTGDELRAPGEPLGPGEIHNSNAPMLVSLASRAGAVARPRSALPRRPRRHRARARRCARAVRRGGRLGRRVGRPPRPRQARARRARRHRGVLGRVAAAGQADLVRHPRAASSCSGCRATRCRRLSPSRCSPARRWRRCRAPPAEHVLEHRGGARRRGPTQPQPRAGDPGPAGSATTATIAGLPQRPPGFAHPHFAARRRRAGADPRGRRARSPAGTTSRSSRCRADPGKRAQTGCSPRARGSPSLLAAIVALLFAAPAAPAAAAGPRGDRLAAQVDRDRRGRRGALRPVGGAHDGVGRSRPAVESAQPREPRPHLLALPHPRDAGTDSRGVRQRRALGRAPGPAADAAALRRARVLDRRRPRQRALADPRRSAGGPAPAAAAASCRSTSAACPTTTPTAANAAHRGRGRELLPGDRRRVQHARCTRPRSRRSTCWSRTRSCGRWPSSTWPARRSAGCRRSSAVPAQPRRDAPPRPVSRSGRR